MVYLLICYFIFRYFYYRKHFVIKYQITQAFVSFVNKMAAVLSACVFITFHFHIVCNQNFKCRVVTPLQNLLTC